MTTPAISDRFCPACGADLASQTLERRPRLVCPGCGRIHWKNAKPCAGALVVRNGKVLLVRRRIEPFLGYWDIPGGFCEADEHPARTALRETREETGLEIELTGLLGLWMDQYEGINTLNVYYVARPLDWRVQPGDDADGAAWFAPLALPRRIAFDNGRQALAVWAAGSQAPAYLHGWQDSVLGAAPQ